MCMQQYNSSDNNLYYPFDIDLFSYNPYSVWQQRYAMHYDMLMGNINLTGQWIRTMKKHTKTGTVNILFTCHITLLCTYQQCWLLQEDRTISTVNPYDVYYTPTMGEQDDLNIDSPTGDNHQINLTQGTTEASATTDVLDDSLKKPSIECCINCETTSTSTWRRFNGSHMCNSCKIYNGHRRFIVTIKDNKMTKRVIRHSRRIIACAICKNNDATFNYVVSASCEKNCVYQCRDCYNKRRA